MVTFVTVLHVIICLFLVLTILLQAGKGAGLGFLGGAGQTVFGGRGATTFLSKLTATMAFLFMVSSMFLAWSASQHEDKNLRARSQKLAAKKKKLTDAKTSEIEKERKKLQKKLQAAPTSAPTSQAASQPASQPAAAALKP
ncbi:MAG: preprotein translocase subunit SecG, partial [Deltaproteobacteria bacterium]|nr:preprotein translocase subunit SecG [Deltaproteobacteria bacterium]